MSDAFKSLIGVAATRPLTRAEAETAFGALFDGVGTPAQMGGFLMALRVRGETVDEYAAAASVMRSKCNAVRAPEGAMDIVGTGGDGKGTLNISTATAFVVAGAGVPVAKHGNRSASGRVGSADVLEALGIHLLAPQEQVVAALPQAGLTFLFAPGWHPALVGLAPLRRSLGVRTVFNLLGPLVNPLRPDAQVLGVARADLLDPMAEALAKIGRASCRERVGLYV